EDAASFAEGEEITLMDWGNTFVDAITRDSATGAVTGLKLRLNPAGNPKLTKKKVTWLSPASERPFIPALLHDYDYLITKKKLEEDDELANFLTPVSEFHVETVGDNNLAALKKGDIIQLERRGYYIVDRAYDAAQPEVPMHLIAIPDGKASSMASKATPTGKQAAATIRKPATPSAQIEVLAVADPQDKLAETLPTRGGQMYTTSTVYGDLQLKTDEEATSMYTVKKIY
ncbi:ribosomal protein L25/Gln-tRNA synthetase, partial [Thamnocephalis sphaerospora]